MTLRKGSKVWVEDKTSAWVAAGVTDFIGKQVQVVTDSGKKVRALSNFEFFSVDFDQFFLVKWVD